MKKRKRMNFQDYLAMETRKSAANAVDDAAYERKLSKKLSLRRGRLDDMGDNLTDLLGDLNAGSDEEMPADPSEEASGQESGQQAESGDDTSEEKSKSEASEDEEESEAPVPAYVPPHQRNGVAAGVEVQLKRRVKGYLNRLTEENVETVTSEISELFQIHSRKLVTDVITGHVLESCSSGPRGNEQYAAVFAACIAGLSCLVGMDFGANFLAGLASCFEQQYKREDSLGIRNLTLLFASLYNMSLLSSELVYDLLQHLCKRFNEIDVATIFHLIQGCGMGLRNQDPASMKDFIISVHERTAAFKRDSTTNDNEGLSKRVEYMLEAICEVKNNKRKAGDGHSKLKKWLQKLKIEEVQLRSLAWKKLLDPTKKGQWWLGSSSSAAAGDAEQEVPSVVNLIDSGAAEAEKMLKLAATQRMNTDGRRAIFSIVMSSEDYVDAFEKLLRLTLTGKQDREIVRVIVECCLQEKVFNKYYALLASKLCHHDKNHRFSLQYCIWDHFKELPSMELRRSLNLAKLLAFLVGSSALSLTALKAVEFGDCRSMTPKSVVHFRAFFEAFLTENDDGFIASAFSRIASSSQLSSLQRGLALFLRQLASSHKNNASEALQRRLSLARKCLLSSSSS